VDVTTIPSATDRLTLDAPAPLVAYTGVMGTPGEDAQQDDVGLTAELLDEWALWMRSGGYSERTIAARSWLVGFMARSLDVDSSVAGWQDVARFMGRATSPGTRSTYYGDLNAWFNWLRTMGYRTDNPMERLPTPKPPKRRPRPITTEQLQRILATVNRRRTRAMVLLAAYQGLRAHEIAKFRGEDIDGQWLHVVGKGAKEAWLPLHPDVAALAVDFPRYDWWFPSYTRPGKPVAPKSVVRVLSELMERAQVNGVGHQLRHWYGTEVLRAAGGNTRVAQELLRHESLATTAGYTQVDDTERRAAILGLPRLVDPGPADVVRRLRVVA
jgi:integrase/recombinase XerD